MHGTRRCIDCCMARGTGRTEKIGNIFRQNKMGGFGSGGWNCRGRPVVQECRCISVAALKRLRIFSKGAFGTLTWGTSSVSYETRWEDLMVLQWRINGDPQLYYQVVGFQWTRHRRNFGGTQTYLVCGRCHSLRTRLYMYENRFWCRCCHGLSYATQRERKNWRLRYSLEKLAGRLGWELEWGDRSVPHRPKGMHRTLYQRLSVKYMRLLLRYYQSDSFELDRILNRSMPSVDR